MTILRPHRICHRDLNANPNLIYVFGDNSKRVGMGRQANEMREEPNAHGVATLWQLGQSFKLSDTEKALTIIEKDIRALLDRMPNEIVWPSDGIGTGSQT